MPILLDVSCQGTRQVPLRGLRYGDACASGTAAEAGNRTQESSRGKEFRIHYQGIVSLETSRLIGFEALIRWQHPEMGLLGPDKFIGVAEETGLIIPVGKWVLREACEQIRYWQSSVFFL